MMLCRAIAEQVYDSCAEATALFVHAAGFEDVIIGLSGGIDSSLVAVMAADALGAQHVHGMLLPGPYSSRSSIDDAVELARRVGIDTMEVPIGAPYSAFVDVLSAGMGEPLQGLAAENTQARCRMVCLMAASNAFGWMMLNTGNKSEAAMGYSTLYGDTAGAFSPIGGLYKGDVYELSRWRNSVAAQSGDSPPIPGNVITKAPSAELSEGQSDEASLGIAYDDLDAILIEYVEHGLDEAQLLDYGFDRAQVEMVLARYAASAFKRAMEPPYPPVAY